MDFGGSGNQPSVWIFIIIVLATLMVVVIGSSFVMHMIQRRQRKDLSRRITLGQVDLEALGIKRLNIPREEIEKMPRYTFTDTEASTDVRGVRKSTGRGPEFSQSSCSICLDDFVPNESSVRELPCRHIFHPECIDPFLRENSSLCPLCKKSAMPPGVCPINVTNVMVRRERLTRRLAEGRPNPQARPVPAPPSQYAFVRAMSARFTPSAPGPATRTQPQHGEAVEVQPEPSTNTNADTELGPMPAPPAAARLSISGRPQPPPDVARQGRAAVRTWRREQLARQQEQDYTAQAEEMNRAEASRPLWRRVLRIA